jgi:hypothetical protein
MTVTDTGPLDWRIGIVDKAGRPTPEFQRRWTQQRLNNAAIGTVSFGSGPPPATPAPADGAEYVDTSTTPYTIYVGNSGAWHKAGVTVFTELSDAPPTYTGSGDDLVRVNSGATGLEFVAPTSVLDTFGAAEGDLLYRGPASWITLSPGTTGQFLETGGSGAAPMWSSVTVPTGANPTSTASDVSVIGSATTYMRSDGAPAVQKASATQFGLVKVDGTTITSSGGVISSVGGGSGGVNPNVFVAASLTPPTTSQFTFTLGSGSTQTFTNMPSGRGVVINTPTVASETCYARLTAFTVPAAGTNFTVTCAFAFAGQINSSLFGGIALVDTGGQFQSFGIRANPTYDDFRCTNINSFSTDVQKGQPPQSGIVWSRIQRIGTNFVFSTSTDGETWVVLSTQSATTFLAATLASTGFYVFSNSSPVSAFSIYSFTATVP